LRQSERLPLYRDALEHLNALGLTYPCKCKRQDIELAMGAPQEGIAQFGPDGRLYPGTCRARPMTEQSENDVIRLNMELALAHIDAANLGFVETGLCPEQRQVLPAEELLNTVGDIVLARRDMGTSYHLSVVIDDAAQRITHVVRGKDLFEATKIHVVLQKLLGLPTPIYHHHKLIRDPAGKRLAKRDDARAIAKYRADGATPQDIRSRVGL
jgi:glutamyl-Q tRNA(Asp) synthetase